MSSRRKGGGKRAVSAAVTAIMADRDIEEQFRTIDSATKSVRKADADPIPAHDQPDAPGALNPNAIEPKAALAQASEALSDNGVDSSESSSAPHSTASARYKRQTRRGVVTSSYDDSPQQPDKQPTFPATLDIKIDARSALEAWAHSSHQAAEPQQSPDVPFLPPPKAITRQKEGAERHTLEPLEMPSTLAVSAACDVAAQPAPASSGNTDSHIRSKAGKIFAEKGVHAVSAGPEASSGQRVAPITQFSTRTAAVHRKDRDGVAPLPSSAGGGPVPTYHRALPKAGSKEYEAFEKHVRTKFDHYDKDKHGVLNEQDAMALAVDLHKEFKPKSARLSDADAKADALKLMRRIDKNADNLIEFDEFLPWYTSMLDQIHGFVDSHTDPASPVPFSAHTPVQPGIAVLSPEQERQSKRNVEDALSRLERRAPDHTEGAGNTAEGEGFLPVTQYSTRGSTPSMRKTPITQFSARGARTPATGLGSLYSPRHRAWQVRDAKLAQGVEKSRHGGETSAQMSTTAGALSVPPCSDEDREVGLERWVGSRPPSVISVASAASSTDAKITAKRRELRHAMSSDDDDSASAAEMHTGRQALEYTREPGWESASDDQYQGMAVPPSGIRKMAIRRRDLSKQQSRLAADGKHHHRETSRRANGVSHAMRREWASQILGELKGRFDYMHRGQKPYFIEWKFRTEVSNVHYQLLALKIRRYNRGLLHRFMLSWHADAHDKACDRRLCLREERKFRSRLFKAYFQNWKLYTGRIRRHAGILYRALWREVSYFFKVWAKDVEQVLWMRDRLWQLRQRRCARALRLCLTGMRDVVKSRQHMQLFSDVLCRDLLTETVVFLHAWRDLVRELNFLHTRARRCKSRWRSFEYYSHFHAWWFTMVTEQASRAKVRRADIHMTESTLLKFHCGWLQAIDRMRYLTHAGAGIFERHERLLLKAAFAEMNFISMSNDSLRKALTALLEKHINRLIIGVFRAWFAMIYDVRMKFRSRMFKRHLSHKALCSIMQAWHARHVFWRRMERKFRVLRVKYTLEMQRAILHAWRGTAKTCSDRAKKVELTQRLHLARLCTQAFQCWQRWTKTYVTRIIAVAGWAISRQDLRCISMCLKRWKHEMEREASLAVKGRRVETTSRARACHRCVKVWKAAVARNMRRSVGRLSEHLTWALCCVLSELLRMSRLVRGMQHLAGKNNARYLSDHFFAWQRVIECYFRREIIVQQSAIRRAYVMAGIVFKSWKMLEDNILVADPGRLDTVLVKKMMKEKQMTTKSFQSLKASLAVAVLQKKTAQVLHRKTIASPYCVRAYYAWKEAKEFSRFGGRVVGIFVRRFNIRLFQSWKFKHRLQKKVGFLRSNCQERCKEAHWSTWRDRTRKYKKVAVFLCRSEERSLRGLILDWRKCVDIRLSLVLKFGLLKQKFVRDARLLQQTFAQLAYNKTHRQRMVYLQRQIARRVAVRLLTTAARFLHQETKNTACRKRKYLRCLAMVKNLRYKSCMNSWRRWVYTKKKTLEAVDQIMDHM